MKRPWVVHPVLVAAFPVLSLFASNIHELFLGELVIPLVVVVGCAMLWWALLGCVVKDLRKAGIIASVSVLMLFSYGPAHEAISRLTLLGIVIGRHRYLLLGWGGLFALSAYLILRARGSLDTLTRLLNGVGVVLVAIPLVAAAYGLISREEQAPPLELPTIAGRPDRLPDIYYITLDGYARADVLQEVYHYDNSDFLNRLADKGFYIAQKSSTNYGQTGHSLASSLNFMYLDELAQRIGSASDSLIPLIRMIHHNRAARFLQRLGYTVVVFFSGTGREFEQADVYLGPRYSLSEFQHAVINMTPIPAVLKFFPFQFILHRERLMYTFDHLADMATKDAPVFVMAHLLAAHPPFVFGEQGEPLSYTQMFSISLRPANTETYRVAYTTQLTYVNRKIEAAVTSLTRGSAR